jgi:hypothetical protein
MFGRSVYWCSLQLVPFRRVQRLSTSLSGTALKEIVPASIIVIGAAGLARPTTPAVAGDFVRTNVAGTAARIAVGGTAVACCTHLLV